MKFFGKILTALLLLVNITHIYAQYSDNFSDGDFTSNPVWAGTTDKFLIVDSMLRLMDANPSGASIKAYLATPSTAIDNASWQCKLKLDLDPTSGNYMRFYLASDNQDLTGNLDGYFIMIGGVTKEVSLYKQTGNTKTKIIDGMDYRVAKSSNNILTVRATHDNRGNWKLYTRLKDSVEVLEGTCVDASIEISIWSGIFINYSSSRSSNYWADNFIVTGRPHTSFNKHINRHDIVFSEVMADPSPQVALPDAEYVEIYNRSADTISLEGFHLYKDKNVGALNRGYLPPKHYAILCATSDTAEFSPYGQVIAVNSFPSITNSDGLLVLTTDSNQVISWLQYSDDMFGNNAFKKDGGWSLERVDLNNLNNEDSGLWQPSLSENGGTPGSQNSVSMDYSDMIHPSIVSFALSANDSVTITFNKEMNDSTLKQLQHYSCNDFSVTSTSSTEPKLEKTTLAFSPNLNNNQIYQLHISGLIDVSGKRLNDTILNLAIPETPVYRDLVINEILFNPASDGVDFVELYNRSQKVVDLSELFVTKYNSFGYLDNKSALSSDRQLCFPGQYVLLSEVPSVVCKQYAFGDSAIKLPVNLPSLPDDTGNVVITLTNGTVIDAFAYSQNMQNVLIDNSEGVSLERVNPDDSTQTEANWQSAASTVKATPGYKNSQFHASSFKEEKHYFSLERPTFTPNNDGYNDLLFIHYQLPTDGYAISITAFTPNGHKVVVVCNNQLAGTDGEISWDGRNTNGKLCPFGIYVLFIQAINPQNGTKITDKIVCVLGG